MNALLVLLLLVASSRTQDATSLANFFYNNVGNLISVNEMAKIADVIIAQQACGGATLQQIIDNFDNTVQQNIGGLTESKLLAVLGKLQQDLGNDADAVRAATANVANNFFPGPYNIVTQYCGTNDLMVQANNQATQQAVQDYLSQLSQAISAVSAADWNTVLKDLGQYIYFSSYGYTAQ
uniref:DUF148 domain-containing protein n=1 Tax=Steinernema glaseri TaxID=37863 RepID=A0A1I8AHE1_9BILA